MSNKITPTKFDYIELPALRFIGIDAWRTKESWEDMWRRKDEFLPLLESLNENLSPVIPHVCAFCHHDDGEINDHGEADLVNRYLIGRFFNAGTPVPDGYDYHDLKPQTAGYAVFENMTDIDEEFWTRYVITRDRILGDGVGIPYPVGYWHGEVYIDKTPIEPPFCCGVLFSCNK